MRQTICGMSETSPHRVLLHNDDKTPMDFVVAALTDVFGHSPHAAGRLMLAVHTSGSAEVARLPRDAALEKVEQLHARAAEAGLGLTASVSPAHPSEQRQRSEPRTEGLDLSGLSRKQVALVRGLTAELRRLSSS